MTYQEAYAIKLLRTRAAWFSWTPGVVELLTRGSWHFGPRSGWWASPDALCKIAGHPTDHLPRLEDLR